MVTANRNKNIICYKKQICLGIAVSLSVLCLCGCSDGKEKTAYQLGVENLNNQNYAEALSYFKASEDSSNLRLAYRGEGMANLGMANYDDAILCFENALHESNGLVKQVDFDINKYMAVAQYKKGDLSGAKETYTNIIQMDSKDVDAYYLRGKVTLDMDDIPGAKADYDAAIALSQQNSDLYIRIYEDLFNKGMESDAKSYINLALKNISKPSEYQLGIFNYYLGDYTQARNYFETAKETKKTSEGIIYLGKTYEALGDPAYAMSLYDIYVTGDTESPEVYNELGKLKFAQRDYEGALSAFETGLKSNDLSFRQNLMYNRIVAYEYLQNFKTASTLMDEYVSLYPDDEAALRENIFLSTR